MDVHDNQPIQQGFLSGISNRASQVYEKLSNAIEKHVITTPFTPESFALHGKRLTAEGKGDISFGHRLFNVGFLGYAAVAFPVMLPLSMAALAYRNHVNHGNKPQMQDNLKDRLETCKDWNIAGQVTLSGGGETKVLFVLNDEMLNNAGVSKETREILNKYSNGSDEEKKELISSLSTKQLIVANIELGRANHIVKLENLTQMCDEMNLLEGADLTKSSAKLLNDMKVSKEERGYIPSLKSLEKANKELTKLMDSAMESAADKLVQHGLFTHENDKYIPQHEKLEKLDTPLSGNTIAAFEAKTEKILYTVQAEAIQEARAAIRSLEQKGEAVDQVQPTNTPVPNAETSGSEVVEKPEERVLEKSDFKIEHSLSSAMDAVHIRNINKETSKIYDNNQRINELLGDLSKIENPKERIKILKELNTYSNEQRELLGKLSKNLNKLEGGSNLVGKLINDTNSNIEAISNQASSELDDNTESLKSAIKNRDKAVDTREMFTNLIALWNERKELVELNKSNPKISFEDEIEDVEYNLNSLNEDFDNFKLNPVVSKKEANKIFEDFQSLFNSYEDSYEILADAIKNPEVDGNTRVSLSNDLGEKYNALSESWKEVQGARKHLTAHQYNRLNSTMGDIAQEYTSIRLNIFSRE